MRRPRLASESMRQVHTQLIDDIDPKQEAAETVRFGLDSIWYDIDLTEKRAEALRHALAKYIAAGRRAGGKTPDRKRKPIRGKVA